MKLSDMKWLRRASSREARERLEEGDPGGGFERSDEAMRALRSAAAPEPRALLEKGWAVL